MNETLRNSFKLSFQSKFLVKITMIRKVRMTLKTEQTRTQFDDFVERCFLCHQTYLLITFRYICLACDATMMPKQHFPGIFSFETWFFLRQDKRLYFLFKLKYAFVTLFNIICLTIKMKWKNYSILIMLFNSLSLLANSNLTNDNFDWIDIFL